MTRNVVVSDEYKNSFNDFRRSNSVFYINDNSVTNSIHDDLSNVKREENSFSKYCLPSAIGESVPFKYLSKYTKLKNYTSPDVLNLSNKVTSNPSSNSSSISSSFEYNYSVNSTISEQIVVKLPKNVIDNLNVSDKLETLKTTKLGKKSPNKSIKENANSDNVYNTSKSTEILDKSTNSYWSNEIKVGVTKTNYVQKLRLKFEMYPLESQSFKNNNIEIYNNSNVIGSIKDENKNNNNNNKNNLKVNNNGQKNDNKKRINNNNKTNSYQKINENNYNKNRNNSNKNDKNNNVGNKNHNNYKNNINIDTHKNKFSVVENLHSEDEVTDISDFEEPLTCEKREKKPNLEARHHIKDGSLRNFENKKSRSKLRRKTELFKEINGNSVIFKTHSYHPEQLQSEIFSNEKNTSNLFFNTEPSKFKFGAEGILPMVEELIHTERNYVKSLSEGLQTYGCIFERKDLPEGLKGQRSHLFGNIEEILEFHKSFLKLLVNKSNDLESMFNSFSNLIEENKFYPYVVFVMNKRISIRLLQEHQSFFKLLQVENGDILGINSFLIKPIQRLQRYPLPLQEFYKTQFGDIRYKKAIAACCKLEKKLRNFIALVNESDTINDIENCFEINLYNQGHFLKAAKFKINDYSVRKSYEGKIFLFEKCAVYTEIKEKRLIYRGHFLIRNLCISSKPSKFTLHDDVKNIKECDFESEPIVVENWTQSINSLIHSSDVISENTNMNEKPSNSNEKINIALNQSIGHKNKIIAINSANSNQRLQRTSVWYDTM